MSEEKTEMICPICELLRTLSQTEFAKHLRNARKEVLLAVRSLIDKRISLLEETEAGAAK